MSDITELTYKGEIVIMKDGVIDGVILDGTDIPIGSPAFHFIGMFVISTIVCAFLGAIIIALGTAIIEVLLYWLCNVVRSSGIIATTIPEFSKITAIIEFCACVLYVVVMISISGDNIATCSILSSEKGRFMEKLGKYFEEMS